MFRIKQFLPSSLYYRFLLIILIPTLLSQIVVSYVFYARHWQQVQHRMVSSVCQEITYVIKYHKLTGLLPEKDDYPIVFGKSTWPDYIKKRHQKTNSAKLLKTCLHNKLNMDFIFYYTNDKKIEAFTELNDEIIKFTFTQNRIESSSTIIFMLWMVIVSSFFYVLSIIFSKNQISPIIKLAKVIEKFGKGQKIGDLAPRGSKEVRIVTLTFIRMSKRIERFITQRTLMLACISHDLRTPLTRIKLALAMIDQKKADSINNDIQEMEIMINSYLNFTKDEEEPEEAIDIKDYIESQLHNYPTKIELKIASQILHLRKHSFKRIIDNLIKNSDEYAGKILIKGYKQDNNYIIELHDNGPGVEEKYLQEIFKPFFRVDKSRRSIHGQTGLGLAISKDIILGHGGEIKAIKSPLLGGLQITIIMPI